MDGIDQNNFLGTPRMLYCGDYTERRGVRSRFLIRLNHNQADVGVDLSDITSRDLLNGEMVRSQIVFPSLEATVWRFRRMFQARQPILPAVEVR